MNKYQEALNWFIATLSTQLGFDLVGREEQSKLLQELVDRDTPIKPKIIGKSSYTVNVKTLEVRTIYIGECQCGNQMLSEHHNYCGSCGKKIDWSE